jgi:hypothetical protein
MRSIILFPVAEIRLGCIDAELPAHDARKAALLEHDGRLVEHREGKVLDDAVLLHVAEEGDLAPDVFVQRLVAAQHDDVRVHAHGLEFLDRVLRGLALVLARALEVGHEGHVDEKEFPLPALSATWRMASMKDWLSMSPTVAPISVMTMSAFVLSATR